MITSLAMLLLAPLPASALEATEPPVEFRANVFISAFQVNARTLDAVELYNESDMPLSIDGWRVNGLSAGTVVCTLDIVMPGMYILPERYLALADMTIIDTVPVVPYQQPCYQGVPFDSLQVVDARGDVQETIYDVQPGAWVRKGLTMTYRDEDDDFTDNFAAIDSREPSALYANELYQPLDSTPVQVTEILPRATDCAPDDPSADCTDYVKLYNPTDQTYDLSHLRLRIGHKDQSVTTSNSIQLSGELPAASYGLIHKKSSGDALSITDSGGWVWLEDAYGLARYDETIIAYESAGSKQVGWAWAYDASDETWKWTSTTTPYNQPSRFTLPLASTEDTDDPDDELKSCAADQYRNPETNRCKKITSSTSTLTPCASNQYRNPETNRCKLIASAATTLTPCAANQFRNPETNRCKSLTTSSSNLVPCAADQYRNPATNRCKKLATAASTLKPCDPGQERNPETNRCRKVSTSVLAATDFPVEPIADTAQAFVGWWALGGMLVLGAGYAGWEWRREIGAIIQRIVSSGKVE